MGSKCCSRKIKARQVKIGDKEEVKPPDVISYKSKDKPIQGNTKPQNGEKENHLEIDNLKDTSKIQEAANPYHGSILGINGEHVQVDKNEKAKDKDKDKSQQQENSLNSYLCLVKPNKVSLSTVQPNSLNENKSQKIPGDSIKLNLNNEGNKFVFNKNEFIKGKLIGKGKFGRVFSGLSANSGEIVAIKIIEGINDTQRARLAHAIEKLKYITHKNLINCIPTVETPDESSAVKKASHDSMSIIYEFCNGSSVKSLLEKYGEFEERLIKIYVRQILEGLEYLHSNGIIHKNLTSGNILVDGNGTIRISDAVVDGALLGDGEEMLENLKSESEIPYYVPPFFVQDKDHHCGPSFDFWNLGCLIIEMTSRKQPWHHYVYKSTSEFMEFLASTHLTPTCPKKLSKSCANFLSLLFDQNISNKPEFIHNLIDHEFFSEKAIVTSITPSDGEYSPERNKITCTNPNLGNLLGASSREGGNKLVNILNPNENATFTVTMTMNTPSQVNSATNVHNNLLSMIQNTCDGNILPANVVLTETNNISNMNKDNLYNNTYANLKKIVINGNILEELDPAKEHSPGILRDNTQGKNFFFEFNSDSENSYNYMHKATESILRQSNLTHSFPPEAERYIAHKGNKFNNIEITEGEDNMNKIDCRISSIQPPNRLKVSKTSLNGNLEKDINPFTKYNTSKGVNQSFEGNKNRMAQLSNSEVIFDEKALKYMSDWA